MHPEGVADMLTSGSACSGMSMSASCYPRLDELDHVTFVLMQPCAARASVRSVN
jgi:hypothetical protein